MAESFLHRNSFTAKYLGMDVTLLYYNTVQ